MSSILFMKSDLFTTIFCVILALVRQLNRDGAIVLVKMLNSLKQCCQIGKKKDYELFQQV